MLLKVGTSGVVYPAAGFGEIVAHRKAPIAEFNIESSATCGHTKYIQFFNTSNFIN
jgi:NAD-dependent SIR2 family protein deacetylase